MEEVVFDLMLFSKRKFCIYWRLRRLKAENFLSPELVTKHVALITWSECKFLLYLALNHEKRAPIALK